MRANKEQPRALQEENVLDVRGIASEALFQESLALKTLANHLPVDFQAAVACLVGIQGKVVFSGVGKSGYIARKIASTLSSTGTPACFLHPTEAGHGDLGLLTKEDALILFSNSGETVELSPLIQYARRFQVPLIAFTSVADSTLAFSSDFVLLLPKASEICPLGLAPTTSTLLMLGLGDALAICLSRLKGFREGDYQIRHPAGALGRQLLKVSDIMRTQHELPLVPYGEPMGPALLIMSEKACGCLGVIDTQDPTRLVGVITDGDLRRHMTRGLLEKKVEEIMTLNPLMVAEETLVTEALTLMNEHRVTLLFVRDSATKIVGLVHLHDCLKAIPKHFKKLVY